MARIYLTSKAVYQVSHKAADFLNGLTSNDLDKPDNAFLNIHGRIIATFDQLRIGEDVFLLCLEADYAEAALTHLDKYLKLSGSTIEKMQHHVYFDLDNSYSLGEGEHAIAQKAGKLVLSPKTIEANVSQEAFTLFRLKHNMPMQGIDYTDEMLLNISMTDFISFTKGCFLGQEPLSKVYNRSKPTWRLVPKSEKDCSDEEQSKMTSKVLDQDTGETYGFVFEKNA